MDWMEQMRKNLGAETLMDLRAELTAWNEIAYEDAKKLRYLDEEKPNTKAQEFARNIAKNRRAEAEARITELQRWILWGEQPFELIMWQDVKNG